MPRSILLPLLVLSSGLAFGQLNISDAMTPQQLVEDVLLGGGVTASNITFAGNAAARASFTATNSNLGLDAGVILSSGTATEADNPASFFISTSHDWNPSPDPDLEQISGYTVYDKAVLEFDFVPTGDTLRFRYVFGSQEYPSFTCSTVNDAFGFFLSGPGINGPFANNAVNLALVPDTEIPISINTVNSGTASFSGNEYLCAEQDPNWQQNSIYYVDNSIGTTVAYEGFTVVLTAFALVNCGETYHIKLAIADGGDSSYDSAVFLEAGSFTSSGQVIPTVSGGLGVDGNTMQEGCGPFELVFTRLGDLTEEATVTLTTSGSATVNDDYSPAIPPSLYFGPNVEQVSIWLDVPVDPDGPETIQIDILQLIACANQELLTTFVFDIESPEPLTVASYDINGICGETHLLDPQVTGGMGEYVYAWSTGEDTPTIEVSPGVTTVYDLTVSDGCAVEPVTVQYEVSLPVYPPLEVTMGPDLVIHCLETEDATVVSASGGDNDFTYEWSLQGVPVGTGTSIPVPASDPPVYYVMTVTDGCGSSIQDSLMVSTLVLDPIEITTSGDVTVICPGDETELQIIGVTGGTGVYTYEWEAQDGTIASTTTTLEVTVDADHTYTITATDQCDNTGTTPITTFLPVYAPFAFNLPADRTICAGDTTELLALVTGGSGYYFLEWEGLTHADPWLEVSPMSDTQYMVTATDQCGEVLTDQMTVRVEHVSVNIVETNRGMDDWYLQAATLPYAETWVWDMGDSTRYRGPEVYHSYYDQEEHWVTLSITTANGCEGMDSLLLRAPSVFYFPNAFTPDGDGHNDVFGPMGEYIEEFEMIVFDRWGHQMFQSSDALVTWDGTINGSDKAPTGVYIYKYRIAGHYFEAKEGYGHVTLLQGSVEY